jgi:hypothetical protein
VRINVIVCGLAPEVLQVVVVVEFVGADLAGVELAYQVVEVFFGNYGVLHSTEEMGFERQSL